MSFEKTGVVEKMLSALIFMGLLFPILYVGDLRVVRISPILIAPLMMIWFPDSAEDFFSSRVKGNTIRNWGWLAMLLLGLPVLIATLAIRYSG